MTRKMTLRNAIRTLGRDEFEMGLNCAACGKAMHIEDGLDPTPECNPCAQTLLADAREENRKLKAEVRRLRKALRAAEAFLAETPNPMAFSAILFLRTQILCALRRGGKR